MAFNTQWIDIPDMPARQRHGQGKSPRTAPFYHAVGVSKTKESRKHLHSLHGLMPLGEASLMTWMVNGEYWTDGDFGGPGAGWLGSLMRGQQNQENIQPCIVLDPCLTWESPFLDQNSSKRDRHPRLSREDCPIPT
jgi:hypothetical protein